MINLNRDKLVYIGLLFTVISCKTVNQNSNSYDLNNKRVGTWIECKNDTIVKTFYKKGEKQGESFLFVNNMILRGSYKDGEKHGKWKEYQNNKLRKIFFYDNGMLNYVDVYENGKIIEKKVFSPPY